MKFLQTKFLNSFHTKIPSTFSCNSQGFYKKISMNFSKSTKKPKAFDPYMVLDLNRKANWMEIKKQYYKLARQYHPDLNKNDERSRLKFMQIKEAYEFFERKYNPAKYSSIKTSYQKDPFEEEGGQEEEESIRDRKNPNKQAQDFNNQNKDTRSNENKDDYIKVNDYFKHTQMANNMRQQDLINDFLKIKGPNPRSEKMVDRHNIRADTIEKGKLLGPDSYPTFTVIVFLIYYFILAKSKKESENNFRGVSKTSIMNVFRNDSAYKNKEYEKDVVTPLEETLSYYKNHIEYEQEKVQELNAILKKEKIGFQKLNEMPAVDLKAKFNSSLNN